jgi:hypothetical protein
MPANKTGHKGFDFWKDEFTSAVQQIEVAFHERKDATELVQRASSILRTLALEARNTSNHPALKQERVDIYKACKMQIETYTILNEQKELFQLSTPSASSSTMPTNTRNSGNKCIEQIQTRTQGQVTRQNSQLQAALRSLKESEEIAQEITGELLGQRETLERTQGSMEKMRGMTEQARVLLKSMNRKWWQKW